MAASKDPNFRKWSRKKSDQYLISFTSRFDAELARARLLEQPIKPRPQYLERKLNAARKEVIRRQLLQNHLAT